MKPGLGILIGLPIAAIFILASLAAIVIGRHVQRSDRSYRGDYDPEDGTIVKWAGIVVLVLTLAVTAIGFWPYQKQYHYWQPVNGTVSEVASRILPAGDRAVEQKFVVKLAGREHPYGIQDTRAALLKKGDSVSLSCIREWEFGSGDHGYNCRWGAY